MKHPPATKREAYRLYLLGESRDSILEQTGIAKNTLDVWIYEGGWVAQKQALSDEAEAMIQQEVRDLMLINKVEVMNTDLMLSNQLKQSVARHLINKDGTAAKPSARELDSLAKAAKNASDIGTRIVGISGEQGAGSKTTINIGMMASMKPAVGVTEG